jgi:hypothetical protein
MSPRVSSDPLRQSSVEPEVDLIARAVLSVPGVQTLDAGVLGEIATYLPGRRVTGVRRRGSGCEVHVVLDWGAPIVGTSALVRDAIRPFVSGPIDVTVEDLLPPTGSSA